MARMTNISKTNIGQATKAVLKKHAEGVVIDVYVDDQAYSVAGKNGVSVYKTSELASRALKRINPNIQVSGFNG